MNETMTQKEFINRVRRARKDWEQGVRGFEAAQMEQAGFSGEWSLKDVMAHIAWYEREMVQMLEAREFGGSELWELPLDERNAAIYTKIKGLGLDRVQEEARMVYTDLLALLAGLSDEDLNEPGHFPGMPLDWLPWQVIASNTYEHYDEHARQFGTK
jgi:hypothetical protein